MVRKIFLKYLRELLEKEEVSPIRPGSFQERRFERELVRTELRGSTTVRTWREYDSLYEITFVRRDGEFEREELLKEKIFVRQYTEEMGLSRVLPRTYPQKRENDPEEMPEIRVSSERVGERVSGIEMKMKDGEMK